MSTVQELPAPGSRAVKTPEHPAFTLLFPREQRKGIIQNTTVELSSGPVTKISVSTDWSVTLSSGDTFSCRSDGTAFGLKDAEGKHHYPVPDKDKTRLSDALSALVPPARSA